MTKYVPRHMSTRSVRTESARMSVAALRGGRSAVALSAATALPLGAVALSAAPAVADTATPESSVADKPTLSFGSTGDSVVEVQALMALVRDGWYGPVTTSAVKDFQRANNLQVDGVVGQQTWKSLAEASNQPAAQPGTEHAILTLGDEGSVVRSVQRQLNVDVDGIFGDETEAAVIDFQKEHKLQVDGIIGPETATALAMADAAKTSAPAKSADSAADDKGSAKAVPAKVASKPAAAKVANAKKSSVAKPAKAAAKKPVKAATPASTLAHPNAFYELPFPAGQGYVITQGPFGAASHHKYNDQHHVDFGTPSGSTIVASAAGTVYSAEYTTSGGYTMLIKDATGYCMEYAHLSSFTVAPGQRVAQGQRIAYSGATGQGITGPHLHWGIVDCSSYTSIHIADSKELGTSYVPGAFALSQNGARRD